MRIFGIIALSIGGCDSTAEPVVQTAARVEVVSGDGQSGIVGQELSEPIIIRVTDDRGTPIADHAVQFRITGGEGQLTGTSGETDAEGLASTHWVLGTDADVPQSVEIRLAGEGITTDVRVTVQASVQPDQPALASSMTSGPHSGQAGALLPDSIEVQVTDRFGNVLPGEPVTWAVVTGGGSVQPSSSVTDANGIARTSWRLGSVLGAGHLLEAEAGESVRAQIAATVALPANAVLTRTAGNGQSGAVTTSLASAMEVRLVTSGGVPISGAAVTWSATTASGTVTPVAAVTNVDGRASANFSLGRVAGSHQVFARVEDLPLVTFAVTATACPVARLNAVQGGGQSGVAGTPLGTPLAVRVTDSGGNAIIGAAISWSGTGSVSPSTTVSNSSGQATVQWTPANATGTQSMTASLGCSDAVFSASVRKRVATVDVSPSTPEVVDGGTISLSAVPRDEDGVPLGGVPVTWSTVHPSIATVSASGVVEAMAVGSATIRATAEGVMRQIVVTVTPPPRKPVTSLVVSPAAPSVKVDATIQLIATPFNEDGEIVDDAVVTWSSLDPLLASVTADGAVRGVTTGEARIRASSEGVTRDIVVRVTPTGAPGVPVSIQILGGNQQTGPAGSELPLQLVARVTDSDGNPVADAYVLWVGNGLPFADVTSATAEGVTRNYWSLGSTAGPQRIELYTFDFGTGLRGALLGAFTATALP